ncbi:MAG: DUF5702 domain-containing protein [Oscillospiraceae bacterium]|nr:DUF5702 domain-containing protein [Oscillospiraceae bacterium]
MRRFVRDTKGAVTVFITLLLIPAMLISGTAVDLARIHTAHSTIQNANQLAANTMLTQYKALLYDIYGIMGIAEDDPILWKLLDDYIKVAVFGEEHQDRSLGTFQIFYGSNITLEEPYFPEDKNLRNEDVLRRQIEEYMKFRGPVLLVQELLERLTDNKIVADSRIINDKLGIDSAIADIHEKYKELHTAISAADRCTQAIGGIAGGSFGFMSSVLTEIHGEFLSLATLNIAYMQAQTPMERMHIESLYEARRQNISALTVGSRRTGLIQAIENAKRQADNFKPRFDLVVTLARELDTMKDALRIKIDDFEQRVNNGEISEELRSAFTQAQGDPPSSLISQYRSIISWAIEPMAIVFRDGGYSYIDDIHKPMLDEVRYRNRLNESGPGLSIEELTNLPSDSRFNIGPMNLAMFFASIPGDNVTYRMLPGFLRFAEHPGDNAAFFAELDAMMNQPPLPPVKLYDGQPDAAGANSEKQQRNLITELLDLAHKAYNGLRNEPLGAMYINDAATPAAEDVNILDVLKLIPQAVASPVLNIMDDPLGSLANAGDYVLLLTYCSYMFSNYSTSKPESVGKTLSSLNEADFDKNLNGVPMSPKANYFYQSELEYLYNGSDNASTNLSAVTRLLLLVRLVCNYIKVFSVPEVTAIVTSIKAAFAWAPPLAVILGELARAAFVAAESVVDVAALRSGHRVPLFKNTAAGQWICTPRGVLAAATRVISDGSVDGSGFNDEKGFSYIGYMMFFFLTRAVFYTGSDGNAATELARRAGNLIEWNIVNFESGSTADEGMMAEALARPNRFELAKMKTDFSLTTAVDLRMLFLSMAFAQNFSDSRGIGMPLAMPIRVTEHRGY